MAVEFNYNAVLDEFKKKRQKALAQTAFMGVNIAALNTGKDGREHVITGTSRNTKHFTPENIGINTDTIRVETGVFYDVYLEKRFGIMARAFDEIKPWFNKFIKDAFNG